MDPDESLTAPCMLLVCHAAQRRPCIEGGLCDGSTRAWCRCFSVLACGAHFGSTNGCTPYRARCGVAQEHAMAEAELEQRHKQQAQRSREKLEV
jgi:hypothetical protein